MKQLEIEFFWPLTEQIPLNLDFIPCLEYQKQKYEQSAKASVMSTNGFGCITGGFTTTNIHLQQSGNSVGYWQITEGIRAYQIKKPNYIVRQLTKLLLNWSWANTK
jgi:hypothetical protein